MSAQPEVKELSPIFLDISPNTLPTEMESLCMNCMEEGKTTMLLTKIPFFREVIAYMKIDFCIAEVAHTYVSLINTPSVR